MMPAGPGRRAAAEALRGAGYRVRAAREPYEGTARFVERPAQLVVLSMERFRSRDTAFITAVKKRAPATRILLLVPEGRRAAALTALKAGADAYAAQPFYPEELLALASSLLAREQHEEAETVAARSVGRLAAEIAHAVNNPLQILALLGESTEVPEKVRTGLSDEIHRIQRVVKIVGRYGLLRKPQRAPESLGHMLRESLASATEGGLVTHEGAAVEDGPPVEVDTSQARVAFDSLLSFLAARAPAMPVAVSARVRALPATRATAVEAAVRGRGVDLDAEALAALEESVLLTQDETREVYPGLALPAAIARNHGGAFIARASAAGAILGLRFPLQA